MAKLALIFIVEAGYLEQQALLLAESVTQFSQQDVQMDMFACAVRENKYPCTQTIQLLNSFGATAICEPLNTAFDYFPLCNGIHAAAYVEKNYPEYDGYLLVDTDTVFLGSLNESELIEPTLIMRTVDNQGIGSTGVDDKNDLFWQRAFALFELPLPEANVLTSVRHQHIRPYYNSGFVLAYQLDGFMQQWKADFITMMQSDIRTDQAFSRYGADYGFIEQFTLSITSARFQQFLRAAPENINYPLPFRPMLKNRPEHPSFDQLLHVHYHKWFQHAGFLDHITTEKEKKSKQYHWLAERLPLQPEINDEYKC